MTLSTKLVKSLGKIAEAKSICRAFSTSTAHLQANEKPSIRFTNPSIEQSSQSKAGPKNPSSSMALANSLLASTRGLSRRMQNAKKIQEDARIRSLEQYQTRKWKPGDVYAPHDLSPVEMKKWRSKTQPFVDNFDTLGINPMNEWKNYAMMSEYMTSMGRIKHSRETGLRRVNQRRVARAIRRVIGMGFMPSVHMHPEMLELAYKQII
ncbi:hypothetical protein MMC20_000899 [Loxospora ochrophaea]|nr:hypothetical protein [Loxospora ochrophaea]